MQRTQEHDELYRSLKRFIDRETVAVLGACSIKFRECENRHIAHAVTMRDHQDVSACEWNFSANRERVWIGSLCQHPQRCRAAERYFKRERNAMSGVPCFEFAIAE